MIKLIKYPSTKLLFLLVFMFFNSKWIAAGPLLLAAEGYVSGQLNNVSRGKIVTRTYVGEIPLGNESITFISFGIQPRNLVSNPWHFCFEKDIYEEIENFIGNDVVLEFKTPKSNTLLSCSSVNELVTVHLVNRDQSLEQKHSIGDIDTSDPEVSYGVKFGRITNVIKNKSMNRTII